MYAPPGMPRWRHRLTLALACFDGEPSAEEIAEATGYRPSSAEAYLRAMTRDGLVDVARHEDEIGRLPSTFSLTAEGEVLFTEIVNADAALRRLARQRRIRQRA